MIIIIRILYLQQLVKAFVENKPLLKCEFPDHTMEVEISDSDESDIEEKKEVDNAGTLNICNIIFKMQKFYRKRERKKEIFK